MRCLSKLKMNSNGWNEHSMHGMKWKWILMNEMKMPSNEWNENNFYEVAMLLFMMNHCSPTTMQALFSIIIHVFQYCYQIVLWIVVSLIHSSSCQAAAAEQITAAAAESLRTSSTIIFKLSDKNQVLTWKHLIENQISYCDLKRQ